MNFLGAPLKKHFPVVDRSTKPPPEVNRNAKPVLHKDQSYCNMPPPVNRGTKPRPSASAVNSYENYPNRNKHLPHARNGSLPVISPYQNVNHKEPTDEYCHMTPRRSETTRCYSLSKRPSSPEDSYEEMASLNVAKRDSSSSSSSSSLSCHEEEDDAYLSMEAPGNSRSLPAQVRSLS